MKRVLAAVDTSETAELVLARAVELARATGAKLRLVRAVTAPAPIPHPGVYLPMQTDALISSSESALRAMADRVPEDLRDGSTLEIGRPADVVCAEARSYGADIVVIGAHDYSVLSRVLGTNAARIVDKLDRPVLVVRSTPPAEPLRVNEARTPLHDDGTPQLRSREDRALVAAAVGSGVGMLAGVALDDDNARATSHDRALDDTIGVTKVTVPSEPEVAPAEILRRDHDRLEVVYAELLAAYRAGDWAEVRARWDAFDRSLRRHMETEETEILPAFRAVDARATVELLLEHDELRRRLDAFGVRIDLHAFVASDAETLIERVRAHAAREERLLYPWVDRSLSVEVVQRLSPAA